MRKPAHSAQQNLGTVAGGSGNNAGPAPEPVRLSRAVPPDVISHVGGHGLFIELRGPAKRGDRECRAEHCVRCGKDTPHEFVCLQPAGPRVWGFRCSNCRRPES